MGNTVDMPIALSGGVIYLLMALTVWGMFRRTPHAQVVRLWALGAVCAGSSLVLIAGRSVLPLALGFGLSTALIGAGMLLQTAALRLHLARPRVWQPLLAPVLVGLLLAALMLARNKFALFVAGCAVLSVYTGILARHAWVTAMQERSRSAVLLAWSQGILSLALLWRGLAVALGLASYQQGQGGFSFLRVHAVTVLAALFGSLGFMGLMLDITRRAERRARDAQVAESVRREAAELQAQELRSLLAQRDTLAAERERLLRMLAHEIRQPLHNASGALQAAGQALQLQPHGKGEADLGEAAQRLRRAEMVLGGVRSVLDNTLAAATLLSRSAPRALQEVELDFLIDLALGDLDPAQRSRVQVRWLADLRQAEVEPGLLRLALRNLLVNAFSHGGPDVAVQLQVAEQDQPPALLLRVVDDGPGLPSAATAAPPAGAVGERRQGLGLHIVQQVAARHGGRLDLLPQAPHGLQAVLVLPLFVA